MAILAALSFFLLLADPALGKETPKYWNIDCGGNSTITGANGLPFEGDGSYVRTGEIGQVQGEADRNISLELSTLRAFPKIAPWKNCYRVPVEQGTKVLVRTKFYYGNYDGQNSPPTFRIYFDMSADGCDVVTKLDGWVSCEAVYVTASKQGTDICLIQTQTGEFPFVSTIEIWRLLPEMYGLLDFNRNALFLKGRFAFGASKTIRYPADSYNRDWEPNDLQGVEGGVKKAVIGKSNGAASVNTSIARNDPPSILFSYAAVAPMVDNGTAGNLTIHTPWLPSELSYIYFNMYYTNVDSGGGVSDKNQSRRYRVFLDGTAINASLILTPETGVGKTTTGSLYKASNSSTFDLVPTQGSTLPSAISGMEIFVVPDVINRTNNKDVEGLSMLQSNFTALRDWNGDPCHPEDYIWEWVGCKKIDSSPPRINKLFLSKYGLSGDIPDFSSLDALEYMDLSFNNFDSLPPSLANNISLITRGNPKIEAPAPSSPSASTQSNACIKFRISKLVIFILLLAVMETLM